MKRGLAVCLTMLILFVAACAQPAKKPEKLVVIAASATGEPTQAPTMVPTATPSPVPSPTPRPTPMIGDEWYAARTEQMRVWMREFGDYSSEEAIEEQLLLWDIDPNRSMIALTFDDGPVYGVTDKILDLLAQYNVRATFFVKGIHVAKGAELIERAVAQGCEIGNHSWTHTVMENMSFESIRQEILSTNQAVRKIIGVDPKVFRPPGGSCKGFVYSAARSCSVAVVRWSQSGNVSLTDPAEIAATVMHQPINDRYLRDGDIILLHDTHDYMVEAVEIMLPMLLERGYQLVTVSEILMLSEDGLVYGERYDHQ